MQNTEQAKQYFAKVLPAPTSDADPSFINIHWTKSGTDKAGKPAIYWDGRACADVDDAMSTLRWISGHSDVRDIYACMSRQSDFEMKKAKSGANYRKAIRASVNAVGLKSLFIDIDVKADKGYATVEDAIAALNGFREFAKLPKPSMVVFSGGGLHVYWTMARTLLKPEWEPLAFALSEATKQYGLKCDTQCTVDAARILRVPSTYNRKEETPRPVIIAGTPLDFDYTVERLQEALAPFAVIMAPTIAPRVTSAGKVDVNDELSAGIEQRTIPPTTIKNLVNACPFALNALMTGGKDLPNPLWNMTTLMATFTDAGRKAAHAMAAGHPDYTIEATDELYDRKEKDRAQKNIGWPKCQTISATGATQCQSCPNLAKGSSPFHAATALLNANPLPTGPVVDPTDPKVARPLHLPEGYMQMDTGYVAKRVEMEDGSSIWQNVLPYPIFSPWLQKNPWSLHFHSVTETGETTTIELPFEDAHTMTMRSAFQSQGVIIDPAEAKLFGDFLVAWIKELQLTRDAVLEATPYGWSERAGKTRGFTFSGVTYTPEGNRPANTPDLTIARQYRAEGELQPWLDAAKIITDQGRMSLDCIVASAFAAPLVRFTGHYGLLLSTFSRGSGVGKSTALQVAHSVWGKPHSSKQGLSDTQNSVMGKLGHLRSLPVYWDELKTESDTLNFVNIVFQLSGGKEKSRMNRSAAQREPGTWQTMLVSASNDSLLDFVVGQTKMTTAGLYRMFEYEVDRPALNAPGQISTSLVTRAVDKLNANYGVVGQKYAEWLGANVEQVDTDIANMLEVLENGTKATNDERFWIATVATILQGAVYAKRMGFVQFDIDAMKVFLLDVLEKMRHERNNQPVDMDAAVNVSNILAQYLADQRGMYTLFTNQIWRHPGKPPLNTVSIVGEHNRNLGGIRVQVGVDDRMMRISSMSLSNWLLQRKFPRHVFMRALEEKFGMKSLRGRLGGGTHHVGSQEYVLEIDFAHAPELNIIDET